MIFKLAEKKNTDELICLWKECFPEDKDEDEFLMDFFETFFLNADNPADIVTAQDGDGIQAMAVLIPVDLRLTDGLHPIYYLYAMCTAEEMRGRGAGLELLRFADRVALENGKDGIALLPANEKLIYFYEKAGYVPAFCDDPDLPQGIEYPEEYLDFEGRYEWDGAPDDIFGMFRPLKCKIKGQANMAYPLN